MVGLGLAGVGPRKQKFRLQLVERVGIVLLLLISGFVFLNSPLFAIREVRVEGNERVTSKEITGAARIPGGENIFRVNLKEAAARVRAIPAIKNARAFRRLPSAVVIRVEEREPIALVPGSGGFYALDATGVCIGKVEVSAPLPVVTGAGAAPAPGKRLESPGYQIAVKVLKAFDRQLVKRLAEVHVTPYQVVELFTTEGVKIYLGPPEELREKGRVLSGLLAALGNQQVTYIDLQAAGRPVVKFAQTGEKTGADDTLYGVTGYPLSGAADSSAVPHLQGHPANGTDSAGSEAHRRG